MATIDLGMVTAYAYAVAGGYEGTEAEFEELLGNIADDLAQIENLQVIATTLAEGSSATASYADGVLTLGIPRGNTGATGATGPTGPTGATGNGIASITLTSTSGAVHTYTITFTDGTTTTFDVTDGEVTTESLAQTLEEYAKVDGAYEGMTVGNAEQLVSTVMVEDSEPYTFRTSGGSADIGNREYDEIVGGTVAWNQLVSSSATSVTVTSGHKYYAIISGTKSIGTSNGTALTVTGGTDIVIDLTQLFGSTIANYIYSLETATAGAGVAFFRKFFPNDYYEYNAGELKSVESLTSHDTVGFNQWDEEWENGYINSAGQPASDPTAMRSKNFVRIFPNTTYYGKSPVPMGVRFYDENQAFVGTASVNNATFTTPSNAQYLKFYCANTATYNNDICINLSWSGYRNGEYEEYVKHTYPLDSSLTLRGIPKLTADGTMYYDGDVYEADGTVTRKYRVVDLGSLSWSLNSANVFQSTSLNATNTTGDMICSNYVFGGIAAGNNGAYAKGDKTLSVYAGDDRRIYIRDDSYTDATAFKTSLNGVYLVYELATPTTETATPFASPQIVDDFGTEEYVTTSIVPVGHNTEYPSNLRDKLQHLPDLADSDGYYLIQQSDNDMSLIAFHIPRATGLADGTYTLKATVSNGTPTYSWEADE